MAGHNKWSNVTRLKCALDAKRGKQCSRLAKEITLAAETGNCSLDGNPQLRSGVLRSAAMADENIERAIKGAVGADSAAAAIDEIVDEGCIPGGGALVAEAATDYRDRAAQDLRSIFNRNGGDLATSGAVLFQLIHRGQLTVPINATGEGRVPGSALDEGADDISAGRRTPFDHHSARPTRFRGRFPQEGRPRTGLGQADVSAGKHGPANKRSGSRALPRRPEALEDNDDVQNVHANADISEALLVTIGG